MLYGHLNEARDGYSRIGMGWCKVRPAGGASYDLGRSVAGVTGGLKGIGKSIALEDAGARVVIIRADGSDKVIVDVNTAAEVLLRSFPGETARRKTAMTACLKALRGEAHRYRQGVRSSQPRLRLAF